MIKKIFLFLIIFFPFNSYGLIKVDITRGNLNPLPLAVSPLAIDNNSKTNDITINGVLIDKTSHEFIKNSKLDFEENLMGKSFRIHNPDAKASCGCGISFSI